jgi:FkbM family methyltransferase
MNFINEAKNKINTDMAEVTEQQLAKQYIKPDDVVLELGARYGTVSCIVSSILNDDKNLVAVEPDDHVWEALDYNMKSNGYNFNILKGIISQNKGSLIYDGYGTRIKFDKYDNKVNTYSLKEVKLKYKIKKFSVLIADCEGCFEQFLKENLDFLDEIRLIILESDFPDNCNYENVKLQLKQKGFVPEIDGFHSVWIKKEEFTQSRRFSDRFIGVF